MAKNKKKSPYVGKMSSEEVAAMVAHRQSGAAGVHSDQKARKSGTGFTNRVNSRSAARRVAIAQF